MGHVTAFGAIGVRTPTSESSRGRVPPPGGPDGFSYVEVMVAVVLVGVTVIAALVGLQSTVISARVGTERSQLLLWSQGAAEALHRVEYVACDATQPIDIYQATVDAVDPPEGLQGGSLIVDSVRYLSIDPVTFVERWDDVNCDTNYRTAGLRLTATSAEGTMVDHEVIIDG